MNEPNVAAVIASASGFITRISELVLMAIRKSYTRNGLIQQPLKEWYGTITSVNGVYTFDISSAGFTQILHVDPKALFNGAGPNDQVIATVNTVSLTSIRGRVVKGATDIFKSNALIDAPNCTVMIKVSGI